MMEWMDGGDREDSVRINRPFRHAQFVKLHSRAWPFNLADTNTYTHNKESSWFKDWYYKNILTFLLTKLVKFLKQISLRWPPCFSTSGNARLGIPDTMHCHVILHIVRQT